MMAQMSTAKHDLWKAIIARVVVEIPHLNFNRYVFKYFLWTSRINSNKRLSV